MSKKESALYSGLNSGGCSLMGEDISPTLISRYETKTGNTQDKLNVMVIENYPNDSRFGVCQDGVFQTLRSRMGTGGATCQWY